MKFWKAKKFAVIPLIAALFSLMFTSCQHLSSENQFFKSLNANGWLQAYEVIDQGLNGGQGYASYLETVGILAWRESRVLQSYLNVYRATLNTSWLYDKFIP